MVFPLLWTLLAAVAAEAPMEVAAPDGGESPAVLAAPDGGAPRPVDGAESAAPAVEPPLPQVADAPSPEVTPAPVEWLKAGGYLQVDGVGWAQGSEDQLEPTTGQPLNRERLLIRRARLSLSARHDRLSGSVELDANTVRGTSMGLTYAEVDIVMFGSADAEKDGLVFSAGLLRIPFASEVQERDRDRLFLERSQASRALFPGNFDLAVRVDARWKGLLLQVALTNGQPLGSGSLALQDPDAAKDWVGRVGANLASSSNLDVQTGLSILEGTGFHPGTSASKDVLVWRDQNEDGLVQTSELQIIPATPATPSATFHRFAVAADARVRARLPRLGDVFAFTEVVWASNLDRGLRPADPIATGRDVRELGWMLGAMAHLGASAFVGIRYDHYDADFESSQELPTQIVPTSAVYSTWAFLLGWGWSPQDHVVVELDVNRNPDGRDAAGLPANLPSNTLTGRLQFGF